MKPLLSMILAIGLLAPAGCGSEVDPGNPGASRLRAVEGGGDQEAPSSRPQEAEALPKLTGDADKDKATILSALKRTKAAWQEASNAWHEAMGDGKTKPDADLVARLETKARGLADQARQLQELLDRVRAPKQEGGPSAADTGIRLTGDKEQDAARIAAALRTTREDWERTNREYMALLQLEKQPPESKVDALRKRSAELKARAAALQQQLEAVRRGS